MAKTRANAVVDIDVQLDRVFLQNFVPFSPFEVRQVEIISPDGSTVLQTIPSGNITEIVSSEILANFRVTMDAVSTPGTYFDKWYWTPTSNHDEQIVVDTVTVFAVFPSGTVLDITIEEVRSDIGDELETKINDAQLRIEIRKSIKRLNFKLCLTGTPNEVSFADLNNNENVDQDFLSLLVAQTECLIQKRFYSQESGKGIKVKQSFVTFDNTAGLSGRSKLAIGPGSVCDQLEKDILTFNIKGAMRHGKAVW